jgi:hypothetical protein
MRGLVLPVVCLVMGAAVAGCGGGSMSLDPVASAATNTEKSGAFSFTVKEIFDIKGHTIAITGQGVADLATNASRMSLDMAGLPAALTKNGTTGQAEQIGTVIYMKLPFLQGQLPDGKQWFKLDLAQTARAQGIDLGSPSSFNFDPKETLQELLASGNARRVGTETIQGERMTHYHSQVDLANIAHIPADQRPAVQKLLKAAGTSRLPVDVWVDSQHMLRRETMTLPLGKGASARLSVDLSQFGSPVDIEPPSADDVFDATQIAINAVTTTTAATTTESTTTSTTTP